MLRLSRIGLGFLALTTATVMILPEGLPLIYCFAAIACMVAGIFFLVRGFE